VLHDIFPKFFYFFLFWLGFCKKNQFYEQIKELNQVLHILEVFGDKAICFMWQIGWTTPRQHHA